MRKTILTLFGIICILVIGGCEHDNKPDNPFSTINRSTYIPDYVVSKYDLIKDIDQYLDLIDEVHGDPYRLISKKDLEKIADSVKTGIMDHPADSVQLPDCYYALQYISSAIKDGHTMIRKPKNWRKLYPSHFPIILNSINDTVVIRKNLGNEEIPAYARLISINDQKISKMQAQTLEYISGTLTQQRKASWAKNFPYLLHTYFKIPPPWIIRYEFNGIIKSDTITGMSAEDYISSILDDYYSNHVTISTYQSDSVIIPVLGLSAFNYSGYSEYTALIDSFFTKYKDEKQVVIDLRDNTGGNGLWSLYLLDYFTDSSYSTYKTYKNKISPQFKEWAKYQLNSHYYSEGKSPYLYWYFRLFEDELYYKKILDSEIRAYVELDEQFQSPHNKKFNGKVFLLVSGKTWSAGVVFAAIFKVENMGVLVGKETGGRVGFNSDPINIELTHTKLTAKIPTAILVLPEGNNDRGVIPEVDIDIRIRDLQSGTDPYMTTIVDYK